MRRFFLLLILLLSASPAAAWWEYGHYTVARIAERQVKVSTRLEIQRLIARSALLETPSCRIRNIADASYWPDCVKKLGERFSYASPWHYQNVDICQPFDLSVPCRDGNCVSAQIDRNAKLLADKTLPTRERLMALAFLVHFVGDLHMPLHAGDKGDLGGNRFRASYGIIKGRNLHAIWDGYLADRGISEPPGDAAGILTGISPSELAGMSAGTTADWSRESWEAARQFAYGSVMADPCGPAPATEPVIDEATTRRLIPIVRTQVAKGGMRLARLLDEALT
jgi:hypothetical protein